MKILHVLTGGNIGGIETLCKDYIQHSEHENIVLLFWEEGPLAIEMKNNGVEVINLNVSSKNIPVTIHKFIEVCRKNEIDTVIVHHAAPMAHLCLMVVKKAIPNITTIAYAHGNAVDMCRVKDKKGLKLRRYILSMSLKEADKVVAISNSVKNSLIEIFNTPKEKIHVIYNGVDTSIFTPNKKTKIKRNKIELIYVGRLIKEKGVQNIIYSLYKANIDVDYRLRIVGDGPYRDELENITNKCNLQDKIEFCGNRRDVPELLQEADVFLHMPDWEEGFGITVIEAMASAKICIVANSGAMPEIILNKINGYLIEKGNVKKLGEKIKEVAEQINSDDIHKISENAIRRAQDFSIEIFAKKLDNLILDF